MRTNLSMNSMYIFHSVSFTLYYTVPSERVRSLNRIMTINWRTTKRSVIAKSAPLNDSIDSLKKKTISYLGWIRHSGSNARKCTFILRVGNSKGLNGIGNLPLPGLLNSIFLSFRPRFNFNGQSSFQSTPASRSLTTRHIWTRNVIKSSLNIL